MSLSLLLDQQISPEVAEQTRSKRPEIPILSLYEWRNGDFVGVEDSLILRAAADEGVTLVTYDRRTIPPILKEWGTSGVFHSGVVFIDNRTIASNDFGIMVRALISFYERECDSDWRNRIGFLPAPSC